MTAAVCYVCMSGTFFQKVTLWIFFLLIVQLSMIYHVLKGGNIHTKYLESTIIFISLVMVLSDVYIDSLCRSGTLGQSNVDALWLD